MCSVGHTYTCVQYIHVHIHIHLFLYALQANKFLAELLADWTALHRDLKLAAVLSMLESAHTQHTEAAKQAVENCIQDGSKVWLVYVVVTLVARASGNALCLVHCESAWASQMMRAIAGRD